MGIKHPYKQNKSQIYRNYTFLFIVQQIKIFKYVYVHISFRFKNVLISEKTREDSLWK